jgi:hypothetical protein
MYFEKAMKGFFAAFARFLLFLRPAVRSRLPYTDPIILKTAVDRS